MSKTIAGLPLDDQSVTTPVCLLEYGDDIVPHVPPLGLLEEPFHNLLARAPLRMSLIEFQPPTMRT